MKTTILILISCFFCSLGFSQNQGEELAIQLLEQEKIAYDNFTPAEKLNTAMGILDTQKERKAISEEDFQKHLGVLMASRNELYKRSVDDRVANARNQREVSKVKKGDGKNMFDLSRERLDKKLKQGKITPFEYDARMKNLAESEAKRKKKLSGN